MFRWLLCLLAVLCITSSAHAVLVTGTIGQSSQIDYYSFTANSNTWVYFDVLARESYLGTSADLNGDGEITNLDAHVMLFRDDGALDLADYITDQDDSGGYLGGDGSLFALDPWFKAFLAQGNYILAIGASELSTADFLSGVNPVNYGTVGDYRMTIDGDVTLNDPVVPEPASVGLISLGLGGLAAWRRRRQVA